MLKQYGLTPAQYDKMFADQNGRCKICGGPPRSNQRLPVEHDHETRRVRALVCHDCNVNKIGSNTVESLRLILALMESDFDGRLICG